MIRYIRLYGNAVRTVDHPTADADRLYGTAGTAQYIHRSQGLISSKPSAKKYINQCDLSSPNNRIKSFSIYAAEITTAPAPNREPALQAEPESKVDSRVGGACRRSQLFRSYPKNFAGR